MTPGHPPPEKGRLAGSQVPLYKMYCQSVGEGQAVVSHKERASAPPGDSGPGRHPFAVGFGKWRVSQGRRAVPQGLPASAACQPL